MVNFEQTWTGIALFVTGMALSVAGIRLARIVGWRAPPHHGGGFEPFTLGDWLMAMLTGPQFLARVAWEGYRAGEATLILAAILAVVAAGWAVLLGLVSVEFAVQVGRLVA